MSWRVINWLVSLSRDVFSTLHTYNYIFFNQYLVIFHYVENKTITKKLVNEVQEKVAQIILVDLFVRPEIFYFLLIFYF